MAVSAGEAAEVGALLDPTLVTKKLALGSGLALSWARTPPAAPRMSSSEPAAAVLAT